MQFEEVYIAIRVVVADADIEQQLPCPPADIGRRLAEMADDYARRHGTGYYPALEFFNDAADVDRDLLELAEQASWLGSKQVRQQIQKKLRPVFASVRFQSIQTVAYALPPVRPNMDNALAELAKHYTPDAFRIELNLSMIRKDNDERAGKAEAYARKMIFRWLKDSFADVEILSSQAD